MATHPLTLDQQKALALARARVAAGNQPEQPPPDPSVGMDPREASLRTTAAGLARIPVGAGQAVSALTDIVKPGTLQSYNQAADTFLDSIRGRKSGEQPAADVVEKVIELGPGALAMPAIQAAKFVNVIKSVGGSSAVAAATYFDPKAATVASKAESTVLGALAGVGLVGSLSGIVYGIKAAPRLYTSFVNKIKDTAQADAAGRLMAQFPRLAKLLTLAQKSGAQDAAKAEAAVAGNYALKNYRRIGDTLKKELGKYGEKYGDGWKPDEIAAQAGERGETAIRAAVTDLTNIRKIEYDAAMESAKAAVTTEKIVSAGIEGAAQKTISIPGLEDRLAELSAAFKISKDKLGPALQRLRLEVDRFGGEVSLETLVDTLQKANANNWNLAQGLTDTQNYAFGKNVRKVLYDAIEATDDSVSDSVVWLKRARDSYRRRSGDIAQLRRSKVAKVLGLDARNPSPQAALESMMGADAGQQQLFRQTLEKHDPQLLAAARELWWNKALEGSTTLRGGQGAASSMFSPTAFAERMLKVIGPGEKSTAGLFSKADASQIRAVLQDLRAADFGFESFARGPDIENIAMVATNVSPAGTQSRPFLTRMLWRTIGAKRYERLLFTTKGREHLTSLMKFRTPTELAAGVAKTTAFLDAQVTALSEGDDDGE